MTGFDRSIGRLLIVVTYIAGLLLLVGVLLMLASGISPLSGGPPLDVSTLAAPPTLASASRTDSEVEASIGRRGRSTSSCTACSAAGPPSRAARAVEPSSPPSINARRTAAAGTSAALAMASVMRPSSAP